MTPDALPRYDHLREIDYHPESLCPLLLELWRRAATKGERPTLRWQHIGGNPDGVTLFCSPIVPGGAIHLKWDRSAEQWFPGYQERRAGTAGSVTKRDPLDMTTKRSRPGIFRLFADILRDLYGAP
jgi:hypothetical protein